MDLTVPAGGFSESVEIGVGITDDAKRDFGSTKRMLIFFCFFFVNDVSMKNKEGTHLWYKL